MKTISNHLTGLAFALALLSGTAVVTPTPAEAGFWGSLKDVVVDTAKSLPKTAKDAAKSAARDFRDVGRDVKNATGQSLKSFGGSMKQVPGAMKGTAVQAGKDIYHGFEKLGLGYKLDRPGVPYHPGGKLPQPRGTDATTASKLGAANVSTVVNRPNERVTVAKKTPGATLPPRRVSNQAPDQKNPGNLTNKMRDKRLGISINDIKPNKKLTRDRKIKKVSKIGHIDKRNLRKFDRRMKFKGQLHADRHMKPNFKMQHHGFKKVRKFRRDR